MWRNKFIHDTGGRWIGSGVVKSVDKKLIIIDSIDSPEVQFSIVTNLLANSNEDMRFL
jgi:hypothetical protein